jgi:hypothetical protein
MAPGSASVVDRSILLLCIGAVALLAAGAEAQVATFPCILPSITDRRTTPSGACMMCHDGRYARDARLGHPFDVPYPPPMKPDLRVNPSQFNPSVILVDGKVTCVSCHDPASTRQNHLAGPTDGPVLKRLCVACHLRD